MRWLIVLAFLETEPMGIATSCFGLTVPLFSLGRDSFNLTGKNTSNLANGRRSITVTSFEQVAGSGIPSQGSSPILAPRLGNRTKFQPETKLSLRHLFNGLARIILPNVAVHQRLERRRQLIISTFERNILLSININRAARRFARSRQADADVRGFRFPQPVHDAAHHRQRHVLYAFVLRLPDRHAVADVPLNRFGQFLKRSARRASAPEAGRHAGRKRTQPKRLQQFARGINYLAPVATRFG